MLGGEVVCMCVCAARPAFADLGGAVEEEGKLDVGRVAHDLEPA